MTTKAQLLSGGTITEGYRPAVLGAHWLARDDRGYITPHEIEEMRRDPRIHLGLQTIKAPIAVVEREIAATDPAVGEWVKRQYDLLWQQELHRWLVMIEYGRSGGEAVWRLDEDTGLVELEKLQHVYPFDLQALELDGRFWGIKVKSIRQNLPLGRCWYLVNAPDINPYYGRSRLIGAWVPWQEKTARHGAKDIRRGWFVKNVYQGGRMRYPEGSVATEDGRVVSNQDYAREIVEKAETGGVIALPNTKDPETGEYLWSIEDPKVNGDIEGVREYVKDLDEEILEGMGIHPEVIKAEQTGSWAGRTVPFLVFLTGEDQIADLALRAFDTQVVRPGAEANFGRGVKYTVKCKTLVPKDEGQGGQPQGGGMGGGGDTTTTTEQPPPPPPGSGMGGGLNGDLMSLERLAQGDAPGWVRYEGPKHGHGWKSTKTGAIIYQEDMPGEDEHGSDAEGKVRSTPNRPNGHKDWKILAKTKTPAEWGQIADRLIAHVGEKSFVDQVEWQANQYAAELPKGQQDKQTLRARAALETFASDIAKEESEKRKVGAGLGASAGHFVNERDEKDAWAKAWAIGHEELTADTEPPEKPSGGMGSVIEQLQKAADEASAKAETSGTKEDHAKARDAHKAVSERIWRDVLEPNLRKNGIDPKSKEAQTAKSDLLGTHDLNSAYHDLKVMKIEHEERKGKIPEQLAQSDDWTPYRGPHGGHGWKNGATGEVLYQHEKPGSSGGGQEQPPSKLASIKAAAARIFGWLDRRTDVPGARAIKAVMGKVLDGVKATQGKLWDVMERRYGKKAATAIFVAAQATGSNPLIFPPWFIAIPGSTLLAQLPLMGVAEMVKQGASAFGFAKRAVGLSLEELLALEGELSQEDIERLGREVADHLVGAFIKGLEPHQDELAEAMQGFGDDDAEQLAEPADPWQPYEGKRGGKGWKNAQTGRIVYGTTKPGSKHRAAQPKAVKPTAESVTAHAKGVLAAPTREGVLAMLDGLMSLPLADMKKVRAALGGAAGGRSKADVKAKVKEVVERQASGPGETEVKIVPPEKVAAEHVQGAIDAYGNAAGTLTQQGLISTLENIDRMSGPQLREVYAGIGRKGGSRDVETLRHDVKKAINERYESAELMANIKVSGKDSSSADQLNRRRGTTEEGNARVKELMQSKDKRPATSPVDVEFKPKPKEEKAPVSEAAKPIADAYDRAGTTLTEKEMIATLERVNSMSADDVKQAHEALGLRGGDSPEKMRQAVKRRLADRYNTAGQMAQIKVTSKTDTSALDRLRGTTAEGGKRIEELVKSTSAKPPATNKPTSEHLDTVRSVVAEIGGKDNLASLADVRDALAKHGMDRAAQDAAIHQLRKDGVLSASNLEGGGSVKPTERELAATIQEGQSQLGYLMLRSGAAKPKAAAKAPAEADVWDAMVLGHEKQRAENPRLGVVKIPELVDHIKAGIPGATTEQVHGLLKKWQDEDRIHLGVNNDPRLEPRAGEGIKSPRGSLHYVKINPGAKPEAKEAAKPSAQPQEHPATAKPPTTVKGLAEHIQGIEARLPEMSVEEIGQAFDQLDFSRLNKADAVALAKSLRIPVNTKTTREGAFKTIRRLLLEQKEAIESLKI